VAAPRFVKDSSGSAASKFGQMIGAAFEEVVIELVAGYIAQEHSEYELLAPEKGRRMVTLEMLGGSLRQLDTVIAAKDSDDPVALLETKWLKDARHHNDKGAWILQLREIKKKYATVRGAIAILAGYWTQGVGVVLMSEGGVKMVLVATDEQVYSTLQGPLDEYLGDDSFILDARIMRASYPRPWDLAGLLVVLESQGKLKEIASSWLEFERGRDDNGNVLTGADRIKQAIDELLTPLPETPRIKGFEIALQIDTGNVVYEQFDDVESALEFIQTHCRNPRVILQRITPRKRGQ